MTAALPPGFYDRPVLEVARELLGCVVTSGDVAGVIVETEAYHESEPACHAFRGRTAVNADLFGPPGSAYVYRSYGLHTLLNAVCEADGVGAAVLIRAITPVTGLDVVAGRRAPQARPQWTNGPGKVGAALGLTLAHSGTSLQRGPVRIAAGSHDAALVRSGPRIGITKAVELPWRFALAGAADVSSPRLR